jgi:hypothetical protein
VPRLIRGLDVPGDVAPQPGAAVEVDGDEAGRVTSVAPRPGGGSVALALLGRKVVPPTSARVDVAGTSVAATVVDLPFDPDR